MRALADPAARRRRLRQNSGIGTVVDLAAQWLPLVQELNTADLRSGVEPIDLVVPLVVYLDNGTGSDLSTPTRKVTSELLVPPVGNSRAGKAQSDAPALLQRAAAMGAVDRLWDRGVVQPPGLDAAIEAWRPEPIVVVNQSTFPAVSAPLGWVLSQDSIATMDQALRGQAMVRCDLGRPQSALCAKGIGTLGDALAVLSARGGR